MDKIIQSPGKYIQGAGVISRLGQYARPYAKKLLIISSPSALGLIETKLTNSFKDSDIDFIIQKFNRECCRPEIDRLLQILKDSNCDAVVGVGGGKTIDTAKAVAHYAKVPVLIAPTIASSDAPCSALSVIYTEKGEFDSYLILPSNPNLVLVDSEIVAGAPARLLAAGIGDALATYFEARASYQSHAATIAGGEATETAMALARLCYDTLLTDGFKAMLAVSKKVVTEAVDRVIEANTYLSGVGFESGGLAAAHAVHNGLTTVAETHHFYHGEKVAYGTLVQLILENAPESELETVCDLCVKVGLPITLAQLDIKEDIETKMQKVAEAACAEGETIHAMPFKVTASKVYAALIAADQYGQFYLQQKK